MKTQSLHSANNSHEKKTFLVVEFVCKQVSGPSCWDGDKMFDEIWSWRGRGKGGVWRGVCVWHSMSAFDLFPTQPHFCIYAKAPCSLKAKMWSEKALCTLSQPLHFWKSLLDISTLLWTPVEAAPWLFSKAAVRSWRALGRDPAKLVASSSVNSLDWWA